MHASRARKAIRMTYCLALAAGVVLCATGCEVRRSTTESPPPVRVAPGWPAVRTVTLPYRAYGSACVAGDAMYVSVDSGGGEIDTLVRYSLTSEATRTVLVAPAGIADMTANDRWLVWESDKKLYAEPTAGGPRRVLTGGREMFGPALEGDTVAWVDHKLEEQGGRVIAYDLATGDRREIGRTRLANFYNNFVQIRDGRVLWTDIYAGTGHYLVHDLSSARTTDYSVPRSRYRYPGYVHSSGDAFYSISFDRYDEWVWNAQQVSRFTTRTREYAPVTEEGEYVNGLVAGRGAIGIIDEEQRLWAGPADGSRPAVDLSARWGTPVDRVQVSPDGFTAVAGVSSSEKYETRLFIFELRADSGAR